MQTLKYLFLMVVLVSLLGCGNDEPGAGNDNASSKPESSAVVASKSKSSAFVDMVLVESGKFTRFQDNVPDKPYDVNVSAFLLGKCEITQKQWEAIMGDNPSNVKGADLPVNCVSWFRAVEFCNRLSEKEGLEKSYTINGETVECDFSKNGYRLPTEAEWEYAAKGGTASKGFKFSGSDNLDDIAWTKDNSGGKANPVGTKKANEIGLHDMTGNLLEFMAPVIIKQVRLMIPEGQHLKAAEPIVADAGMINMNLS